MQAEEKERMFHTQLVKYGVKYEKAAKAAKILASEKPNELLTDSERQIIQEACDEWSRQHKRYTKLSSL